MSETQENPSPPNENTIRRAREQGKVAFSNHLAVAVTSIGLLLMAILLGKTLVGAAIDDLSSSLTNISIRPQDPVVESQRIWNRPLLRPVAYLVATITLVTIMARMLQVGVMFQVSRAMPDIGNIDFGKGIQRVFSMSNFVRCCQIFFTTLAFLILLVCFFRQHHESIIALGMAKVDSLPSVVSQEFATLLAFASAVSLLVGVFDYYYQRNKFLAGLQNDDRPSRSPVQAIWNDPSAESGKQRG